MKINYIILSCIICSVSVYCTEIIGSRGVIGLIDLPPGYYFGTYSGKNNEDMIVIYNGKTVSTTIHIDYDGLNPHDYLLGNKTKIGQVNWIHKDPNDIIKYGIIDGINYYVSFEIVDSNKADPMIISSLCSMKLNQIKL